MRASPRGLGMEALALIGDLGLHSIGEEEIAKCRAMFALYDEDKDGKLTYAELLTCVRCCGRNPSVEEFKQLVQVVDTKLVRATGPLAPASVCLLGQMFRFQPALLSVGCPPVCALQDGALSFEDFMCLYVMPLKDGPNNEAEMLEAFQAFDKGGNGFMMVDDLRHVLTNMGTDRLTEEEAEMMLKLTDKDGDGVLNYEEIIKVLADDYAGKK